MNDTQPEKCLAAYCSHVNTLSYIFRRSKHFGQPTPFVTPLIGKSEWMWAAVNDWFIVWCTVCRSVTWKHSNLRQQRPGRPLSPLVIQTLFRLLHEYLLLLSAFSFSDIHLRSSPTYLSSRLPVADIRMSKPAEVEKVGANSPMEGAGEMCCRYPQKIHNVHIGYKKKYMQRWKKYSDFLHKQQYQSAKTLMCK